MRTFVRVQKWMIDTCVSQRFCNILVTWGTTRVSQKFCNILVTWGTTRVSQKFCNILVTWGTTRVSQKFCNILITWNTIRSLPMRLLRSWRWQTTRDCEISSLPDTLRVLLNEFAPTAWSAASKFTLLGLYDVAQSSRFIQDLLRCFLQ